MIYRHNADTPHTPASNLKIVTTSAFLDHFGADFKFRTMLVLHGQDLLLWGDGDPTLGDGDLLKKVGWNVTTIYKNWADQLKKQQIASIRNVIVDDSIFDTVFYHPNWKENEYTSAFAAEVGGVNFNANCIDVTVQPTSPGRLAMTSSLKTSETSPMPRCARATPVPSTATTPADSWPRCWRL